MTVDGVALTDNAGTYITHGSASASHAANVAGAPAFGRNLVSVSIGPVVAMGLFGVPRDQDVALWKSGSPVFFVKAGDPPMLLVHGMQDDTVWPKNSRNLATALTARGVAVDLKLYPACGHADTVAALSLPARGRAPTIADLAAFVSRPASS